MSQLLATMYGIAPSFKIIQPNKRIFQNNTDKADSLYLEALEDGPLSTKQLADKTGRNLATVQRQVRMMEARRLVEIAERVPNGANPRIMWRVK